MAKKKVVKKSPLKAKKKAPPAPQKALRTLKPAALAKKQSSSVKTAVAVTAEIVDNNASHEHQKAPLTPVGDTLSTYLANVNKYPLLTREQEHEIAERYFKLRNPKDAEILVTSNLRFVVKVAAEYSKFGNKLIDIIQEGNVGLMHAVKEFNPYKGVRLISYAVWWIRGYIQEYMMRQHSVVRIGTTQNQRKLFYHLKRKGSTGSLGARTHCQIAQHATGHSRRRDSNHGGAHVGARHQPGCADFRRWPGASFRHGSQ